MKAITKERKKFIKIGLWGSMLLIISIICLIQPVNAKENKVIRVAYPIQEGLTEIDEKGRYSGYTYEYLQEISQYTGWEYEFVQVPGNLDESLSALMDMVASGEIDLMGSMLYSDAMNKLYDYSGHSYGIVETTLQVLHDDTRDIVINSQIMQEMRIAVVSLTGRTIEELKEYCKMNLIDVEFILCSNEDEQIDALKDGRADAMLNTSLNYVAGVRNIARFSPKPFYFITSKGNDTDLMSQLNVAISNVERADPYFSVTLNDKYFVVPNDSLLLSDAEEKYIEETKKLKVGILKDYPPFQYMDENTGQLKGICVDLLDYISGETGLRIELVPIDGSAQLYEKIKNNEIDMAGAINFDYDHAHNKKISITRPFVSAQYILILNEKISKESLEDKALAMSADSSYQDTAAGEVKLYENIESCIRAVNKGEADYTYVDGYTAQYYINRPEFKNLNLVPQTVGLRELCFGIARKGNGELLSILNKTILNLPEDKLQTIIYKNTLYKQEFSIMNILIEEPLACALIITGFFAVIIIILLFNIWQHNKLNRQISLNLEKHLQVYNLMEDYFFEYDYKDNYLMLSMPAKEEGEKTKLVKYHCSEKDENSKIDELRNEFVQTIKSCENGVKEIHQLCEDGEYHWIRIAAKTVYDRGVPAYVVGKLSNIDEERKEKEYLMEQAQKDGLTKILNVVTSRSLIEKSMSGMKAHEKGGFLLLDIDHFKAVNDNYGHMRGDQVLSEIAAILRESFRPDDIVGRLGGDEFIVYMKRVGSKKILSDKCDILCRKAREIKLDEDTNITISVGAVLVTSKDAYDDIYQRVDTALYKAKEAGRDGYKVEGA